GLVAGVEVPGIDDERHGMDDESRGLNDEGHSVESDVLGLAEEEEAIPGGQQQAALVVRTVVSAPLGLGYRALRRRELALEEEYVYNMFEVGQGSGSTPKSKRPGRRYDRDIGELFTRSRAVRDEMFSQRYRFRSLEHEHEHERTAMTFVALWRPMMALEAWAGHKTALQRELQEMRGHVTALEQERDRKERLRAQYCSYVSALRLVARDRADTHFLTRIWHTM
nr:hypothetical protein [Tanacetum cinerariifolium]